MQRWVVDASVWIDLGTRSDLLPTVFHLGAEVTALDLVCDEEVLSVDVKHFLRNGLRILSLDPEAMYRAAVIHRKHLQCSIRDTAQLVLARQSGAMLVAGDGPLRRLCGQYDVEVHGTLWLLSRIEAKLALPDRVLAEWLKAMIASGSRLPAHETASLLDRWSASGDGRCG